MVNRHFPSLLLVTAVALASLLSAVKCFNISAILDAFPEYSIQNGLMSSTKVADEVNSRKTLTCLVLPNPVISALAGNHTPAALKNALRLLVLLDYFDPQKLHGISGGTIITTTLYQATGEAIGQQGFVNITNFHGGRVAFRSAVPGSLFDSIYTKSVRQIPYDISVLEISTPIVFPGLFDDSSIGKNVTAVLENAGCKVFASLISSTGMIKIFQASMAKGLTLFAPNDDALRAKGVPDLTSLSSADLVTLLQYHSVASYDPKDSLKTVHHPIATMASGAAGNYEITVSSQGDDVTLHTGLNSARISSTILDETPACILTLDNVLLPVELFGNAPAPTPSPVSDDLSPPPPEATPSEAPSPRSNKSPSGTKAQPPVPMPPPTALVPAPAADSPDSIADSENDSSSATVANVGYFSAMVVEAVAAWWLLW